MEYSYALVLFVLQNAIKLNAITVQLCQVQRPKVLVVPLIHQHTVNIEEETIWHILRRIIIAVPVQTI
jgi:hypothetical protein